MSISENIFFNINYLTNYNNYYLHIIIFVFIAIKNKYLPTSVKNKKNELYRYNKIDLIYVKFEGYYSGIYCNR